MFDVVYLCPWDQILYRKLLSSALRTYVIFEKLPRFRKEERFLKNVGEFLQN